MRRSPGPGERIFNAGLAALAAASGALAETPVKAKSPLKPKDTIEQKAELALIAPGFSEHQLTPETIAAMKQLQIQRLEDNIKETAERIPNPIEKVRFRKLQQEWIRELTLSTNGIFSPKQHELVDLIERVRPKDPRERNPLELMRSKIPEGEFGIFVDADNQRLYLLHNTGPEIEFVFAARVTTGEDGLAARPGADTNETQSGLQKITAVAADRVIPGQDVSYEHRTTGNQIKFTVMDRLLRPKDIYIAPPDTANVGLIAYRLGPGRAIHQGPLRTEAASHGCIRADGNVIMALSEYLGVGSPVYVFGAEGKTVAPRVAIPPEQPLRRTLEKPPVHASDERATRRRSSESGSSGDAFAERQFGGNPK